MILCRQTQTVSGLPGAANRAGCVRRFTSMRLFSIFFLCLLLSASARAQAPAIQQTIATLQPAANFGDQQATGVAVSRRGRVFVNFPDWSDKHGISVAEIVKGKVQPFPSDEWNKPGAPNNHFVCVQSVYVDEGDNLWVLDPAAPKMKEIVKGGPKLVKIDLVKNQVVQTIPFGEDVAPKKSYLNDVRIDVKTSTAYITDSGLGAIIVVNLASGKARRLLTDDHSTQAENDFQLQVNGRELIGENGKPPRIHSDGIALDRLHGYLYFHALSGATLYRVKTGDLRNRRLAKSQLGAKVEAVADTPPPDGMLTGPNGKLYLTDIAHNAINVFDPETKKLAPVITDPRLSWPDSMSFAPDGSLYVTASQIQNMPRFNGGKSTRTTPYQLFKISGPLATR